MPAPRIVVVDDHQSILALFTIALKDEGYRVITYTSVQDAIDGTENDLPDLVIVDLSIEHPDDGWDVCAELTRNPATANIPIIICTAADAARRKPPEHIHLRSLTYLDKPFYISELLSAVKTALSA
jgi:DNA-binding response OmpR family regulator